MSERVYDHITATTAFYTGSGDDVVQIFNSEGRLTGKLVLGAPHIGSKAYANLLIDGPVSDGETFTVNTTTFEFDADASSTEGNTAIDISAGTKTQASGSVVIETGAVEGDTLSIGADVYEIDVEGDGVEAGNIQVDVSAQYAAATATLTFEDVVSDGETVTINDVVFEIDTDGDVTEGNVPVWVGANITAAAAIIALASVIRGNTACGVNAVDGDGDTLVVTAREKGTAGNSIGVSTTCLNASWGELVTALSTGAQSTAAQLVDAIVAASAGGTEAVTLTAGAGDNLGTLLIEATAAGASDGSLGNDVTLSATGSTMTPSGSTLTGGSDATEAEAIALVLALDIDGFEIAAAVDDDGYIKITNETIGTEANSYPVSASGENIAFATATFTGGDTAVEYTIDDRETVMFNEGVYYVSFWDEDTESIKWYKQAMTLCEAE